MSNFNIERAPGHKTAEHMLSYSFAVGQGSLKGLSSPKWHRAGHEKDASALLGLREFKDLQGVVWYCYRLR